MAQYLSDFLNTAYSTYVENDVFNDSVVYPITLTHTTTGTPANGIGTGLRFITETSNTNNEIGGLIEVVTTDVTSGSEDFDFVFKTMAAGATAAEKLRIKSTGEVDVAGNLIVSGGRVTLSAASNRDKYRLWNNNTYIIGLENSVTYGGIDNEKAMTFQMDNNSSQGFWWGDSTHTTAQGAMALTTDGKLSVAHSLRLGYGESDTTTPGATFKLDVNGNIYATGIDFGEVSIESTTGIDSWKYNGNSFSTTSEDSVITEICIDNTNGFYLLATGGTPNVYKYTFTTAYKVDTLTYLELLDVSAEEVDVTSLFVKADGTKIYVVGTNSQSVHQYDLSTAWNLSTASYVGSKDISAQDTLPHGLFFKSDGTKMYVLGQQNTRIYEYNLGTAWTVSTATYSQQLNISARTPKPTSMKMSSDGITLYVLDSVHDAINKFTLSSAWNITSATHTDEGDISTITTAITVTSPTGFDISSSANKVFVSCLDNDKIFEYDTTSESARVTGNRLIVDEDFHVKNNLIVYNNARVHDALEVAKNLAVNGNSITSVSTTFNLLNNNVDTLNIASEAAFIDLGSGTSLVTLANDASVQGDLTVVGTLTGTLTGNASTASAWATGRTITLTGDVTGVSGSFDGSGNLSFATTIAANSVALGTDTTGNYVATVAAGTPGVETSSSGLTIVSVAGEGTATTIAHADTSTLTGAQGTAGIAAITVDGYGHVTAVTTATYLTSFSETDTLDTVTTRGATTSNNITVGDIAVNGGDITTNQTTFGLIDTTATTVNAFGATTTLNLGYDSTAASTTNISTGATATSTTKTINLGTGGASGSTTTINIGSASGGTTTVNNNLTVTGNLTVNGTTTTVNSTTVTVDDPILTLGGDTAPSSDDNKDRGVEFRWHNGTSAKVGFFGFDDSTGQFTFIPDATNTSEVFSGTKGILDVASITGSAASWTTGRTITLTGDVTGVSGSFDGSGNLSFATTIAANSVALGTDTTGNYVASITNGNYITGGDGGSEGAGLTLAVDATTTNTASKVVARDSSGNFAAGTITAALSGNATTATTLATARTIAISGDVTGTATSFNGSADITISAGITADSIVNADINSAAAIADTKLATISTAGKVSNSATTATAANTASAIVARDASGNFTAGTITAALSGNASTASAWATGRTITLTGDVTGVSGSFDGSGNLSFATTIAANSVALGTDTTGNYVATVAAGTPGAETSSSGLTIVSVAGEGTATTIAHADTSTLTGAQGTAGIAAITVDGYGHVTAVTTATYLTSQTNTFGTFAIGADAGYTWGTANTNTNQAADSTSDTLTIVRGLTGTTAGIDLFTNTVAGTDAIKIAHADTSTLSGAQGSAGIAAITVDEMGHVTAVTTATYLTSQSSDFGTVTVTDTDSGYTWGATGSAVADTAGDTLTLVSGTGINIDVDATSDAIRITNTFTESDTLATVTGRGATTSTAVTITNATNATTTSSGALIVTGGVGIGGDLFVGGGDISAGNIATTLLGGNTTTNISFANALTSGTLTVGGTSQTGTMTIDPSTSAHTLNIATGANTSGTKTVNIATGSTTSGVTAVTIGSTNSTSSTIIQSGSGKVRFNIGAVTLYLPTADGSAGQVLKTDGAGNLSFDSVDSLSGGIANIVEDTSPQLGGNLDVNGQSIVSVSNGNILITPNGTGYIQLDGLRWPTADGSNGYLLQTNGSGQLAWTAAGSNTTYTISAETATNTVLRLTGSDASTDNVAFVGSGIVSVTRTDANTITITGTEADTLATVTGRGASTATAIAITNTTASTTVDTGALTVDGGVGLNGNLFVGGTGNIAGAGTITGNLTVSGGTITAGNVATTLLGGNTTTAVDFATAQTSGALTIGGTAQTGTITLDRSTVAHTLNIATGVNTSGVTKTINFGTGGASGSTTAINIGSSTSGAINTVNIYGDLTVTGTTTYVNTTTLNVGDNIITLNADEAGVPSQNAGIEIERGTSTNTALIWNETTDRWQFTNDGSTYFNIPTSSEYSLITANSVALGTDTTGNYVATVAAGTPGVQSGTSGLTISATAGEGTAATIAHADTSALTGAQGSAGIAAITLDGFGHVTAVTTATYLTAEADTLDTVTTRGATTANSITVGDIAVNGGDITTSQTTFNLVNATATTLNIGGAATTLTIGNTATAAQTVNMFTASTGASTYNFATGATANATTKTLNIGTGGAAGSTTNVNIGSSVAGTTTISSPNITISGLADTATTATHYYVETGSTGNILPKTLANVRTEIVTTAAVNAAAATTVGTVTSGTWSASFGAVSGANLTNLTAGNLAGTIPSGVLGNSALFVGTTSIALNRASLAQTLTGVSIDGSAATLTTARTISLGGDVTGSASFNGSADITITATIAANSVALGTDTTGNYVAGLTQGNGISITGTAGEGWSPTVAMSGSYTGTFTATGDICAYSDATLKDNIQLIADPLDKVLKLRGVTFTRKDLDDNKKHMGVIAQEVEAVIPEVVVEDETGIKTVAYGNMVGLLIEAVKELTNQNKELLARIEQLEKK
jgi:hypothetical protein